MFLALRRRGGWHACCNPRHASSRKKRGGRRAPAHTRVGTSRVTLLSIAWGLKRALVTAGYRILSSAHASGLFRLPGITLLTATVASCAVGPNFLPPPPPAVNDYLPAH